MPEMLSLASAFNGNAANLHVLSEKGSMLGVKGIGSAAAPASCAIFPSTQTLKAAGSISVSYLEAFVRVQAYRRGHAWPILGASATPTNVDVVMARYNGYVTVSLSDNFVHRNESGRAD